MDLIDKLGFYIWVLFIGFTGGILGWAAEGEKKIIDGVIGTFTSMFLGWIGYELVSAWLKDEKIALATCGFIAWRGAEWIRQTVDVAIKSKLNNGGPDGYDDADDLPRPPKF
ncbi:hypothetical protein [uncultured Campylobacter sp.]|uniref:hypothetical protein n=1 Tax=uncultured Campylobacter sp. TaxID=218934 RepID=UPI0025E15EF0|nr:hypothetical protein [uncultured Campylobacter sp.]